VLLDTEYGLFHFIDLIEITANHPEETTTPAVMRHYTLIGELGWWCLVVSIIDCLWSC
jgi:hypothetical protein